MGSPERPRLVAYVRVKGANAEGGGHGVTPNAPDRERYGVGEKRPGPALHPFFTSSD